MWETTLRGFARVCSLMFRLVSELSTFRGCIGFVVEVMMIKPPLPLLHSHLCPVAAHLNESLVCLHLLLTQSLLPSVLDYTLQAH